MAARGCGSGQFVGCGRRGVARKLGFLQRQAVSSEGCVAEQFRAASSW